MATLWLRDELIALHANLERLARVSSPLNGPGSARVALAIIAAEDHRYLRHMGIDARAILSAVLRYAFGRGMSGASTIEQQLVRVLRHRYEFTLGRKLSEIILAMTLWTRFSKESLVGAYSQVAYYGWAGNGLTLICGRFGIQKGYVGWEQAILIASLLKRPMPSDPTDDYLNRLTLRTRYVEMRLKVLLRDGDANGLVERARP